MGGTYTGSDGYINVNEYLGKGVTQNADGSIVANITDNTEATVGNVAYDSLATAIDDAEAGETVTLLKDVNVANTIDINKDLTIDLNGKMITGVFGDAGRRVFYVQKGILTLTGEGTVTTAARNDNSFANNSSVIRVGNGSSWTEAGTDTAGLVVGADVTVLAPASYGIGAFGSATEETVTIYGKVLATGSASAVSGNGLDTLTGTTINIEDGAEISAKNAVAIYHPQVGTMTIGAASITGTGGIEAKAGSTTVTVDGATITATGEVDHTANSDGTSTDGYAIAAVENDDYAGNATIRIENGHFIGPVAVLTDNLVVESKDATIEISGGNFSEPVNKEYLADAISAELYSLRNTATPYSYYPSVEEAQAAAQPGDVVTDLSTVTEDAKKFTVVFDYGNGTKKELTMPEGANASLPSLNDRGYNHFQGWNDGTTTYAGGTKVTISKDTTFTAVWTYIPPANPNYRIDIPDFEGGTVTADPAAAKAGATVTLTATPDEGYAVGTITVTDRFGDAVKVTENADGTYTFTMPNGQVTVKATFVETEEPAPAEPFPDVDENDWFYDEVVYVYENGLMNGVENNQFAPNTATNRAMLATILYRLAGQPDVSGDLPFTDVAAGTWYTDAVLWAAQNGIVNGLGENTFAPMNTLTREQLVTMLYRYAEAEGYDVSAAADLSGYPDAGKVQPYAQEAMSWAVAEGIVAGMEDGTLNPAGNATRAQIATILMRFCEGVAK
ncbi:MAG: S-layer homology domain-containing protein [Evtepia sp.]